MTGVTCREMNDFLADYLDGGLAVAERRLFERHLADCADCVAYLRGYAETIRLVRDTREDHSLPADVPDELVRAIVASSRRP